jgi:hypothetical protein
MSKPTKLVVISRYFKYEILGKFKTSYQTARTDLLNLETIDYLKSKLIGKK